MVHFDQRILKANFLRYWLSFNEHKRLRDDLLYEGPRIPSMVHFNQRNTEKAFVKYFLSTNIEKFLVLRDDL